MSSQGVCFLTSIEINPSDPSEAIVLMPKELSSTQETQCFHGRVVHVTQHGDKKEINMQFIYFL